MKARAVFEDNKEETQITSRRQKKSILVFAVREVIGTSDELEFDSKPLRGHCESSN